MPTRPSALDRAVDEQLHGHGHAPQAHEPPASNSPPPHVQPLHSPSPQSSPKPSRSGTRLFGSRSTKRKSSQPTAPTKQRDRSTAHLHEIEEVSFDGLRGVCAISGVHEQVTALALSDVGFVAVAWASRLLVVDLRGPDVVLEETLDADMGEILVLDWSVSALATGASALPGLCGL